VDNGNKCMYEWMFWMGFLSTLQELWVGIGTITKSYEVCTYLKGNMYHMSNLLGLWVFKGGICCEIWYFISMSIVAKDCVDRN
jgi:hypothetical protein